ncbi:MAG: hypothetical protein ABR927_05110 [Bacteroidales bacterium]|jgi:hypothetical protein
MKSFLINLTLFILLIGSFAAGLSLLSDCAVKQRERKLLKINKNINKVFAGDSNIECAINDSLIENSINIAQSGEAYMYSYNKIKSLVKYNSQINTIFIGFSLWDLLKFTEDRWLFSDEFVIEEITNYNYLLNYSDKSILIKKNPVAYIRGLMKSIFSNLKVFIKSFYLKDFNGRLINFGGFENSGRDKLQEDIKMNLFKEQVFEEGLLQIEYLKKISQLCQQKSIKLVLLNTPKHLYYNTNIKEAIRQNWLSVRNSLSRDSLLDLSTFILPDSCFGDLTHLNFKGAKIFSKYLNVKINSNQSGISTFFRPN